MGNCRFLPQVLDFDQNESYFRDFHQILGNTVVFKAKSNKLGKLQKMEKCRFRLQILDLIRMDHIFVIFIKFWVIQSCLKKNPISWESCKNGKNGKAPISSLNLGFDQNESYFRDFHQILGKVVVFKAKSNKFGKLQKWEKWKMSISSSIIGFRSKWITSSCFSSNSG